MTVTALKQGDHFIGYTDGVYLHGTLERENGYDLVSIDEVPTYEGIYECMTILKHKYIPSILYFWRVNGRNRGLVVRKNDTAFIEDAKEQFDKREEWL